MVFTARRSALGVWLAIVALGLLVSTSTLAEEESFPPPTPVIPATTMAPLAPDAVTIPFSLTPVHPEDTSLTLLTRWRGCGYDAGDPDAVAAQLTESDDEIHVRLDTTLGSTGEPCEADPLIRIPVALEAPLGDRVIIDAGDPAQVPIINSVDPVDTGLRYACGFYPSKEAYSVAELLGPGRRPDPATGPPVGSTYRIVRRGGDEVRALGPLQAKGWVQEAIWRYRDGEWSRARDGRCDLRAQLMENVATATWRLRGRRPTARSRDVRIWVRETVCNGRQLFGRVAQPIVQVRPDSVVVIIGSMSDLVTPLGERVEEPRSYFGDYPGRPRARGGGSAFIDCPGIAPAPYIVTLYRRLGDRTLYDGGVYPPRERGAGRE